MSFFRAFSLIKTWKLRFAQKFHVQIGSTWLPILQIRILFVNLTLQIANLIRVKSLLIKKSSSRPSGIQPWDSVHALN